MEAKAACLNKHGVSRHRYRRANSDCPMHEFDIVNVIVKLVIVAGTHKLSF